MTTATWEPKLTSELYDSLTDQLEARLACLRPMSLDERWSFVRQRDPIERQEWFPIMVLALLEHRP